MDKLPMYRTSVNDSWLVQSEQKGTAKNLNAPAAAEIISNIVRVRPCACGDPWQGLARERCVLVCIFPSCQIYYIRSTPRKNASISHVCVRTMQKPKVSQTRLPETTKFDFWKNATCPYALFITHNTGILQENRFDSHLKQEFS